MTESHLVHVSAHHAARENPCNVVARDEDMSLYMSVTRIWDIPAGEIVRGGSRTGAESCGATLNLTQKGELRIVLHGDTLAATDESGLDKKLIVMLDMKAGTCQAMIDGGE